MFHQVCLSEVFLLEPVFEHSCKMNTSLLIPKHSSQKIINWYTLEWHFKFLIFMQGYKISLARMIPLVRLCYFWSSKCHWDMHLLSRIKKIKNSLQYKTNFNRIFILSFMFSNVCKTNQLVPPLSSSAWSSIGFPIPSFHCQTGPVIPSFPCAS